METYYKEFDNTDENKIIYFDIFKEYTHKIESFIVDYLNCLMKDSFNMELFARELM